LCCLGPVVVFDLALDQIGRELAEEVACELGETVCGGLLLGRQVFEVLVHRNGQECCSKEEAEREQHELHDLVGGHGL